MTATNMRRPVLWMETDDWHKTVSNGGDVEGVCLQKACAGEMKAVDGLTRSIRFVISNQTPDRDSDIIHQTGWKLDNFLKNPVVPFAHDYRSLPVAKAMQTMIEGDALVSVAQFATKDEYPFADTVYQMLLGGYLNAVSVGFRPLKYEAIKDSKGTRFLEQELLEYSVVPVPAHPMALVDAKGAGIDVKCFREWALKILDESGTTPPVFLSRYDGDKLYRAIQSIVIPALVPNEDPSTESAKTITDPVRPNDTQTVRPLEPTVKETQKESEELDEQQEDINKGVHPMALYVPVKGSFEWQRDMLEQSAKNFLTSNGIQVDPYDRLRMVAMFSDTAMFVHIGCARGWDEDVCYRGKYSTDIAMGVVNWMGKPKAMNLEVSAQAVTMRRPQEEQRAWDDLLKAKSDKEESALGTRTTTNKTESDDMIELPDEVMGDAVEVDDVIVLDKSESEPSVVDSHELKRIETITTGVIRKLQGKVD